MSTSPALNSGLKVKVMAYTSQRPNASLCDVYNGCSVSRPTNHVVAWVGYTCHLWVVVEKCLNQESYEVEVCIEYCKTFEVENPHDRVDAFRSGCDGLFNEVCTEFLALPRSELANHMPADIS